MSAPQPDPEMMAVAERLARFLESGAMGTPDGIFADEGVTIIENFPPYIFVGPEAVAAWRREMQAHLAGTAGLKHAFGAAHDFGTSGEEAYFSLPTTWGGTNRGVPFRETGGWTFVLTRQNDEWRVLAYGWAVVG